VKKNAFEARDKCAVSLAAQYGYHEMPLVKYVLCVDTTTCPGRRTQSSRTRVRPYGSCKKLKMEN
jgi:hypothetical protein